MTNIVVQLITEWFTSLLEALLMESVINDDKFKSIIGNNDKFGNRIY